MTLPVSSDPSDPLSHLFDVPIFCSHGVVDSLSRDALSPLSNLEIPPEFGSWGGKRQLEFRAGRHHAKLALAKAGVFQVEIGRSQGGSPLFPAGFNGSISHTGQSRTFAVAAVCQAHHRIGIDAERRRHLSREMVDRIMRPQEQIAFDSATWFGKGLVCELSEFASWCFSMKEACYKCLPPAIQNTMDFLEITIEVDANDFSFVAKPGPHRFSGLPDKLNGRFWILGPFFLSAVIWPGDKN